MASCLFVPILMLAYYCQLEAASDLLNLVRWTLGAHQCCWVVQRAAMMISETIPMTIMLMPAAQGALAQSFETYSSYLRDMGWAIPGNLPAALALTTTAAVAGLARLLEHGISPEEYNVSGCNLASACFCFAVLCLVMTLVPSSAVIHLIRSM